MLRKSGVNLWVCLFVLIAVSVADNASASPLKKVTLQLRWEPQFQFAGYYAAKWMGYYEAEGLDVEIISAFDMQGNIKSAVNEVAEGRADFGIGAADILIKNDKTQNLTVLATILQRSATTFAMLAETPINSPSDFAKFKVARRVNDLVDIELQAMLKKEGVDPSKVNPHKHQPGIEHLTSRRVDVMPGYLLSMPYFFKKAGIKVRFITPVDYGIDFYGDSLFTRKSFVDSDSQMLDAMTRASIKGWKYAIENPEEIAKRISDKFPLFYKSVNKLKFNLFQADKVRELMEYSIVDVGHINPNRWQRMHNTLKELGLLRNDLNIDEFIFNPAAIELKRIKDKAENLRVIMIIIAIIALVSLIWAFFLRRTIYLYRKAEESLRKSEERFRKLIEDSKMAIVLSRDGKRLLVNKAYSDMFGYSSPEEMIGGDIVSVIPPENRAELKELNRRREQREDVITAYETIGLRKDGSRFPMEVSVSTIELEDGIASLIYTIDISERKEAEERFRLLTDASQEGVCLHDKGTVVDANNKFVEIFGYDSLDDMLGMSVLELASDDTRHIVLGNIKKGYEEPYEVKALKKDGTTSPIIIHGKKYHNKGKTVRVATVRDISKEKDAEVKILKSLKEKEVLLKEVHHRVKNNMAVIAALLEMQIDRIDNDESIEILKDSQNRIRAMALVHENLYGSDDFSEIDLKYYVSIVVSNIVSSYKDRIQDIETSLEVQQINLDMEKLIPLGLILNEMVTNSIKHAFKGVSSPQISIKLLLTDSKLSFLFEDNGVGIPQDVDIFGGQSLGGKIMKLLVNQLDGDIKVDSGAEGTKYQMTFPV